MISSSSKYRLLGVTTIRIFASRSHTKYNVQLDPNIVQNLEQNVYNHRHHPGIERTHRETDVPTDGTSTGPVFELSAARIAAIGKALGEHPPKQIWADSLLLTRYLRARHPPAEPADIEQKRHQYETQLRDQLLQKRINRVQSRQQLSHIEETTSTDTDNIDNADRTAAAVPVAAETTTTDADHERIERRVRKMVAQRTYAWRPLDYDAYRSLQYLLGRTPAEYAILVRIFGELARRRSADFTPRSFFDFGSGVGTGTWAASHFWRSSIFEYYLVDASRDMNDLADLLLRDGDENRQLQLRNVNFRQFLPATTETKYDLVLSAFSLLELPSVETRLQTLRTLWQKCDRFLVIVEQGTRAGFNVVNEARDYLLYSSRTNPMRSNADGGTIECHVFSPCPHALTCPRHANAGDRTPCNFLAAYKPLPYGISGGAATAAAEVRYEPYSYVVLEKRSSAAAVEPGAEDVTAAWPRLVRPTLVRSRHSVCRMCTANGRLAEIVFTQSRHGKDAYRCARSSRWGDRLPVQLLEVDTPKSNKDV